MDEILKDYTDDSVLLTADGAIRGRDELRAAFTGFFSGLFAPGSYEFTMDAVHVEGDVAYVVWHAACEPGDIAQGTDTFLIRDGTIAVQTYTAKVVPS